MAPAQIEATARAGDHARPGSHIRPATLNQGSHVARGTPNHVARGPPNRRVTETMPGRGIPHATRAVLDQSIRI